MNNSNLLQKRLLFFFLILSLSLFMAACSSTPSEETLASRVSALEVDTSESTQLPRETATRALPSPTSSAIPPTASPTHPPTVVVVPTDTVVPPSSTPTEFLVETNPVNDQYTYAMVLGGPGYDVVAAIQETSDGGVVIAADYSTDGSGDNDPWVIKLDQNGGVIWQTAFVGAKSDSLEDVHEAQDGSLIFAGSSSSPARSSFDVLVMKLESSGSLAWQRNYGSIENEFAYAVQPTRDGGYIVAGETNLFFDTTGTDAWIIKLDSNGNVAWQRVYGGLKNDRAIDIVETEAGDFVFSGTTSSFGDSHANGWLVKLDNQGNILWQYAYGGKGQDHFDAIHAVQAGGFVLVGQTTGDNFYNDNDIWVTRLGEDGSVFWSKTYGNTKTDLGDDIYPTRDGGFILVGRAEGEAYKFKLWGLKLDAKGEVEWSRYFGAGNIGIAVQETFDGQYLLAGVSDRYGAGWTDVFVMKLNNLGEAPGCTFVEPFESVEVMEAEYVPTISNAAIKISQITPIGGGLKPVPAPYESEIICKYPEVPPTPTATPTKDPSVPPFTRKLYLQTPRMTGEDVLLLQERLLALGYSEVGTPDGIFGEMTDQAVRHFQENNGLEVDGIVGEITWTLLFSSEALDSRGMKLPEG